MRFKTIINSRSEKRIKIKPMQMKSGTRFLTSKISSGERRHSTLTKTSEPSVSKTIVPDIGVIMDFKMSEGRTVKPDEMTNMTRSIHPGADFFENAVVSIHS